MHPNEVTQKTVRMMVALTILAWATQTLLAQLGYGQELVASARDWPAWPPETTAGERFVPGTERFAAGVTLEVRDEATVVGADVKLKQIARWSDDDAGVFRPLADLVLFRFSEGLPYKKVTATNIRTVLREAGVNLANINFRGATTCTVARSDVKISEKAMLDAWVNGTTPQAAEPTVVTNQPVRTEMGTQLFSSTTLGEGAVPHSVDANEAGIVGKPDEKMGTVPISRTLPISERESGGSAAGVSFAQRTSAPEANTFAQVALAPSTPTALDTTNNPAAEPLGSGPVVAMGSRAVIDTVPKVTTLRELLITDLCQRVGVAPDALQISFAPDSDKVVNLLSPQFRFKVESSRSRALGNVAWSVTISPPSGVSQRVMINAVARAWQDQLVVAKPVSVGQTIQKDDVEMKRALVEVISTEPMLQPERAIGQQAARDLKPGQLVTNHLLEPVPLVRTGQFVTVSIERGHIRLQTVGRAMGNATFGQTVRVKNETTKDTFDVIVTGPQAGRVGAVEDKSLATALTE